MIEVEAAGATTVAVIAELHAACFAEAWDTAAIARLLAMPGAYALLALRDNDPIGFVIARQAADELEIVSLGVRPDARRIGAADALMRVTLARAAGAASCFLEVAESNAAARALYLKLGFAQAGRRPRYYGDQDALVLRLVL
ncbi:MAG: GNAT family N-acetyltransferase [Alphaproteobacteria bacterium]